MKKCITMKELPPDDRPYELCLKEGPEGLSDIQLLSIIIRTGTKGASSIDLAEKILSRNAPEPGVLGLMHLTIPQLMEISGIGKVKAIQLQCVGELSKRIWRSAAKDTLSMMSPKTIADYYMEEMRHTRQEEMRLLLLNSKNKLIRDIILTKGTINATLTSPREIFLEALRYGAVYLALVHNHPSGDPAPSDEDLLVTKRIQKAGELMDIQLIDHIIIGDNSYISLKERGII